MGTLRGTRVTMVVFAVIAVVLAALVGAQIGLPKLAASRIASALAQFGPRPAVHVSAFPALKLLWGDADRVEIRMTSARLPNGLPLADELAQTDGAGELDARIGELQVGPVMLHDARLRKDGNGLRAVAFVHENEMRRALPSFLTFRPASVQSGDGLLLDGSATVFGATVSAQARLRAVDGAITIAPVGIPFGALATLTVFRDPRVEVTTIGAVAQNGGYALSAAGRLAQ